MCGSIQWCAFHLPFNFDNYNMNNLNICTYASNTLIRLGYCIASTCFAALNNLPVDLLAVRSHWTTFPHCAISLLYALSINHHIVFEMCSIDFIRGNISSEYLVHTFSQTLSAKVAFFTNFLQIFTGFQQHSRLFSVKKHLQWCADYLFSTMAYISFFRNHYANGIRI